MAKKIVKCKYCNIQFDRNAEPFVEVGARRYAHKECAEKYANQIPKEEQDYANLEKYIKNLFHIDVLPVRIRKQIKDFKQEYNYSYSGMLKTLIWWYEIKKHDISEAQGGIGIIPWAYSDAEKYYYAIFLANMANQDCQVYKPKIKEIEIASPRVKVDQRKLFKFGEDE